MPDAAVIDELGRYRLPDHMTAEIHKELETDRFAILSLGIGSSSEMW